MNNIENIYYNYYIIILHLIPNRISMSEKQIRQNLEDGSQDKSCEEENRGYTNHQPDPRLRIFQGMDEI